MAGRIGVVRVGDAGSFSDISQTVATVVGTECACAGHTHAQNHTHKTQHTQHTTHPQHSLDTPTTHPSQCGGRRLRPSLPPKLDMTGLMQWDGGRVAHSLVRAALTVAFALADTLSYDVYADKVDVNTALALFCTTADSNGARAQTWRHLPPQPFQSCYADAIRVACRPAHCPGRQDHHGRRRRRRHVLPRARLQLL